jgi:hypothetical protein
MSEKHDTQLTSEDEKASASEPRPGVFSDLPQAEIHSPHPLAMPHILAKLFDPLLERKYSGMWGVFLGDEMMPELFKNAWPRVRRVMTEGTSIRDVFRRLSADEIFCAWKEDRVSFLPKEGGDFCGRGQIILEDLYRVRFFLTPNEILETTRAYDRYIQQQSLDLTAGLANQSALFASTYLRFSEGRGALVCRVESENLLVDGVYVLLPGKNAGGGPCLGFTARGPSRGDLSVPCYWPIEVGADGAMNVLRLWETSHRDSDVIAGLSPAILHVKKILAQLSTVQAEKMYERSDTPRPKRGGFEKRMTRTGRVLGQKYDRIILYGPASLVESQQRLN